MSPCCKSSYHTIVRTHDGTSYLKCHMCGKKYKTGWLHRLYQIVTGEALNNLAILQRHRRK